MYQFVLLCVPVYPSEPVGTGVHVGMETCLRLVGFVWDPVRMVGRLSLRFHIPLFPSDRGQGALPTGLHPSSSFLKALSGGVSLLVLPLGTGPVLLPRTGRVGVCKHPGRSTQQPSTWSLISLQARLVIPLFWG